MTPAEFKDKAREKLRRKQIAEIDWTLVASTIGGLAPAEKNVIVEAFKEERPQRIGSLLLNHIAVVINANVEAELDSIIADGQLSLDEFNRIFGDS